MKMTYPFDGRFSGAYKSKDWAIGVGQGIVEARFRRSGGGLNKGS